MPITGLLLTLSAESHLQEKALAQLHTRPELQIGSPIGRWVPVALSSDDDAHCRDLHDSILSFTGVEFVDVVYVNFEEIHTPASEPACSVSVSAFPGSTQTQARA